MLLVEDDPLLRRMLESAFAARYDVIATESAEGAREQLDQARPDIVLTDVRLPGASGLDLVAEVRALDPECLVFTMTGYASVDAAVAAMRCGARDFFVKPLDVAELVERLNRQVDALHDALDAKHTRDESPGPEVCAAGSSLRPVLDTALAVARSSATVLLTGESGTGKEVLARFVHRNSGRGGPFVAVNCGAIPSELVESELFGHEAGAFTGAREQTEGRFERAHGGTLLLDEVGELPAATQVKLLRVLQDHQVERVGGGRSISVDVRVIAATNRDLAAEVESRRFREDLYYRLDVISLHVPPLRERKADIGVLWPRFVARFARRERLSSPGTSPDAIALLFAHRWPGNVRELENVAERAVILSRGETIEPCHLPAMLSRAGSSPPNRLTHLAIPGSTMKDIEKMAILRTLGAVGGSTTRAAEILGISTRKVQYRLREWRAEAADGVGLDAAGCGHHGPAS